MVRVGRVLCIATPFILSTIALICLIMVALAGTVKKDTGTGGLYLFQVDTIDLKINTNKTALVLSAAAKQKIGIEDHYTIYLRNYCFWTGQAKQYNTCTKPRTYFWFNPVAVWDQKGQSNITSSITKDFRDGLEIYESGSKDMLLFFYAALAATGLTLLTGITAIFSRRGSFVATLSAVAAAVAYGGTAAFAMGIAGIMQETLNNELAVANNIKTHSGKSIVYTNGLGLLVSIAAAFFWFLSVCCFSGRSPYNERDRRGRGRVPVEKAPYTYDRLVQPNMGDSNRPLMQEHGAPELVGSTAYEPFRHTDVRTA